MPGMFSMTDLLRLVAHERAEEVKLEPGRPVVIVLHGEERVIDAFPVTSDNVAELLRGIATEEQLRELDRCGDIRFTYRAQDSARFRVRVIMEGQNLSLRIANLA